MTLPSSGLWLVLGIFVAEMCVVTVGTLRIIFIARNRRVLAPVLGFFEVLIWLYAIGQTMQHLGNFACCLAFALGFTAGNVLGMLIEKKLAMGLVAVRIVTTCDAARLSQELRAANFGYTCVAGVGATGPVRIVMSVVRRRQLDDLLEIVQTHQPKAFYAVDELQYASEGIFPGAQTRPGGLVPSVLRWRREPNAQVQNDIVISPIQEQAEHAGDGQRQCRRAA